MLEWFRGVDQRLFHEINAVWTHPWLDAFFPLLTDLHKARPFFWIAPAAAMFWWLGAKRGHALKVIIAAALAVALTDAVSHRLIKSSFRRARPQKAGLSVVLRTQPHLGYSFPSNHAANSFAAAAVLSSFQPVLAAPAFTIAALVAYSRVYVGVHFPFDVLAGSLLGFVIGWLVARLFRGLGLRKR